MITFDQMGYFIAAGIFLFFFYVAALLLAWFGAQIWEWIDDGDKTIPNNPLVGFFLGLAGYRYISSYHRYEKITIKDDRQYYYNVDGDNFVIATVCGSIITPMVIGLALAFPTVTGLIALTFFVVFMARSGRRLFKRFERHIVDKDAHK